MTIPTEVAERELEAAGREILGEEPTYARGLSNADMPADVYHREKEHESSSWLRVFEKSPGRYYHRRITGRIADETTDPQKLGTLDHIAVLEPHNLERLTLVIPPEVLAKNGAKSTNAFKEWAAENPGRLHVLKSELDDALWMSESVWANRHAADLLRASTVREHSIFSKDGRGYRLKCRMDMANELDAIVADVKSTSASEADFWKSVKAYKYHAQAALYVDGYESLWGIMPRQFSWLIVESSAPFDCFVRHCPAEAVDVGRELNNDTLEKLYACKRGERPWLPDGALEVRDLNIPLFVYARSEEPPKDTVRYEY